ncbi:S41 family peptidase [Undibacterium sp. TS12]|uniref:S41 family peptidase n=1 Tax=Undibacterium sp. TS12 TaxID=2908202 RepID=UPI001F4C9952|nr:S41 family peptidase [Undibacterium sp. TS12]MCH8619148.1 S41 family peptidase [Undibacterium sp. TS12]
MRLSTLVLTLSLAGLISTASAAPAYYRFPSIKGDAVVFTAEGDLWKVASSGGQAQRLTTHPAAEVLPAISPDGKWLAFSAAYEGPTEAYVMPMAGGLPKRISFENDQVNVLGWTNSGEVMVSTLNSTGPSSHRVVAAINPQSMLRRVFPVADANEATLDDSGKFLYFTRFGLHMTNDNAKQYRGGAVAQLWRYDVQGKTEATQLFAGDASNNRRPMWWKGRLYFVSDRNGAFNIWTANADGSDARVLTQHKDWEVRNASLGDGKIVYQLGADLHVFDIASGKDQLLAIDLVSDFDQQRKRQIKSPLDYLNNVELASKEERLLFTARGRLTIAGSGPQRRIDLPVPENARAREAVFSHDDKSVYAIVDTTGENEIWKFPANGLGKPEVLTTNGDVHRYHIFPSPDGKWLAHSDKRGRLWLLDLATKTNQIIDDAGKLGVERQEEVTWSPDSKTIAIIRPNNKLQRTQIGLYSLDSKQLHFVTSDRYNSRAAVFSGDGRWLYFFSERNFQVSNRSPWGDRNMGPHFEKRNGLYALALQNDNRFPFKPDDELSKSTDKSADKSTEKPADKVADKATDKAGDKPSEKTEETKKPVKPALPAIQYAGLAERLYQVPLAYGNYRELAVDDKRLYFTEQEGSDGKATLKTLAISKNSPQPEIFAGNIRQFDLSADKKHVFYRNQVGTGPSEFYIVEAGARQPQDISKSRVNISDWSFFLNPKLEWQQIYADAWRMHRDFLFDDKMRGVDWNKVRSKYSPLVDRVTDRAELNDVLGLMASEVSTLHSQTRPGDVRRVAPEGQAASLGAVLSRTNAGYRIDHIYHTEPELPSELPPLSQPDLDIREGDVITAINGQPVLEARDISDLLTNQADKQVLMHVKRGDHAARAVIVTPVNMMKHANLRYSDWEQSRSEQVNKATQGRIGYLHLRAMGPQDINSFARDFYSNIERDGLIIDVRRNRGGNIDSWIIEKLLRKAWAFWATPTSAPYTNMQQTFRGHLVVLVDELTYSDGETFAAGIKALKLGPLVGKRTAGAGVWLSDNNSLADNGMIRAAENAQFGMDGKWLVEGVGVAPDIEVDNLPHATFNGKDQQLEAAIQLLEKKLREQPVKPMLPQTIPPLK